MDGKYGVETLKVLVVALAQALSVVVKVMRGNLLALWGMLGVVSTLRDVDFAKLKLELGDLSAAERAVVEAAFAGALDVDATLKAKLTESAGCLEEAAGMGEELVALYGRGVALVARVKALLGL